MGGWSGCCRSWFAATSGLHWVTPPGGAQAGADHNPFEYDYVHRSVELSNATKKSCPPLQRLPLVLLLQISIWLRDFLCLRTDFSECQFHFRLLRSAIVLYTLIETRPTSAADPSSNADSRSRARLRATTSCQSTTVFAEADALRSARNAHRGNYPRNFTARCGVSGEAIISFGLHSSADKQNASAQAYGHFIVSSRALLS